MFPPVPQAGTPDVGGQLTKSNSIGPLKDESCLQNGNSSFTSYFSKHIITELIHESKAWSVLSDLILHYFYFIFSPVQDVLPTSFKMHSTEEPEIIFWLRSFVSDGKFSVSHGYYFPTTADGTLIRISSCRKIF